MHACNHNLDRDIRNHPHPIEAALRRRNRETLLLLCYSWRTHGDREGRSNRHETLWSPRLVSFLFQATNGFSAPTHQLKAEICSVTLFSFQRLPLCFFLPCPSPTTFELQCLSTAASQVRVPSSSWQALSPLRRQRDLPCHRVGGKIGATTTKDRE